MLVARVGGRWYESSQCGWFDFAFLSLSSDAGDQIGARLLNLIKGSVVYPAWSFRFVLLSAVLGIIPLLLVCGVGLATLTLVLRGTTSELDHLYYCGT